MVEKIKQIYKDFGFLKLIKEIIKKIIRELGLLPYTIYIYKFDLENNLIIENKNISEEFLIKTIYNLDEIDNSLLNKLNSMNNEPIDRYLKSGGEVDVVFNQQNEVVGYGCVETSKHDLSWGTILLKESQVWLGPDFVLRDFRRKGIHSGMRYYTLKRLKKTEFKTIFTAVESSNIPSTKTFSKLKFEKVATVNIKRFFGKRVKCEIKNDLDELSILKK